MSELQRSTQVFLWMLAALTLVVAAVGLIDMAAPSRRALVLAAALFALQAVAVIYPLELAPKEKLSLYTSVIFASVLLLEPLIAMIVAGGGTLLGQAIRHQPPHQTLFNTSQTALQAGVAGVVVSRAGWDYQTVRLDRLSDVLLVLVAAILIYGVGAIAVATVVGLEAGQPWRLIARHIPAGSGLEDVSQYALGLLAVIVIDTHVWALPLLLFLAVSVYRASERMAVVRAHERAMRRAAEETARLREEFLMTASHELKTPITAIKAAAQLLSRRLTQPRLQSDSERILMINDHLLTQVDRLQTLVGDLLNASRIHHGRLDLRCQKVDIVDIARQAIVRSDVSPERHERQAIVLDAPESVEGLWDPARIDHVITNLISNALKYSPSGCEVRVRIADEHDWVQLDVSDAGAGIPADEQDHLFEPFVRGSNAQEGIEGSGLGLYITDQIVRHHGGTIAIRSAPGTGTTVTVRLPRGAVHAPSVDFHGHGDGSQDATLT